MIGKLTIDKSSMNISYFLYTIKIIASNGGKISRKNFVKEMADFVGVPAVQNNKENRTAYNKSKLPRYFGFVDIVADEQELNYLVLTNRGEILAEYIQDNGEDKDAAERYSIASEHRTDFIDLIFDSVIFDSFGKNNSGAEQSNTDVEPPKVVFKTIYELGKATAEEICYVMFGLNRGVFSDFDEAIASVREKRSNAIHDYSEIMEEWAITNIVHDCKIINIFTDSNISLLISERDTDNGKLYYQLSSVLSESHKEQLRTISAVYEPLKLFAYTNGNAATVENWVEGAVLGRISDNSQIVKYKFGIDSDPLCANGADSNFVPGVFEKAILAAFQNEKKNIYLVVQNTTEPSFFGTIGKYATLLNRIDNVKDDWHGWSRTPLNDDKLYRWLIAQSSRARSILSNSEVILPSNLHIVGTIIMDNENRNTEFDYEFRRCLIDTAENTIPVEDHIDESKRLRGGVNVLLYGVPGCGKSFTIMTKYCKDADAIERVVFHPDYTYGDFVGQILPLTDAESGKIRYEFSPGPFTRILSDAYNHPTKKYCFIIEEINRGNAPAIFGDIFQLLDRDEEGCGAYEITNADVAAKVYIYGQKSKKIKLPSNLFIFATMNTSDQNVFTLDTAFQRRWNMRMVENNVFKSTIAQKSILDTNVKWAKFADAINSLIITKNVGMTSSEDKRLGAYFVTEKDLYFYTTADGITQEDADDRNHNFPEKVLKYLWDDAFKFTRDEVFKSDYDSLEKLIKAFEDAEGDNRFNVFADDIFGLNQDE